MIQLELDLPERVSRMNRAPTTEHEKLQMLFGGNSHILDATIPTDTSLQSGVLTIPKEQS